MILVVQITFVFFLLLFIYMFSLFGHLQYFGVEVVVTYMLITFLLVNLLYINKRDLCIYHELNFIFSESAAC